MIVPSTIGSATHPPSAEGRLRNVGPYFGTAFRELAHWTGTVDRLNRSTLVVEHVKDDYQVNHKKTYRDLEARCRLHLLPFFGNYRACNFTTDDVRELAAAPAH